MKSSAFIVSILCLFWSTITFAEEITIVVKGMVCSFCAQGIKKTFGKNPSIKKVQVDLDSKLVKLETVTDGVPGDEEIRSLIKDAGYDVLSIERGKGV